MLSRDSKPEEVRAEWVRRLRSGEYRQGRAHLRFLDSKGVTRHCCLGVLCEMAAEAGMPFSPKREDAQGELTGHKRVIYAFGGETHYPPGELESWAGIQGGTGVLANMNDDGKRFSTIADKIERWADESRD